MKDFVMILLFIALVATAGMVQAQTYTKSPFRYVIVDNRIDPAIDKSDEARRFVEILVDNKSFSKEGLTKIFRLVSARFPNPHVLYVNAFTDLNDVETPEEREQPKISNQHFSGPNMKDSAIFIRFGERMRLIINRASGSREEMELKN